MRTNLFKSFLVLSLLILGMGNAWAHGGACTAKLTVAVGTGSGTVYAATSSSATSGSLSVSANCGNSDSGTHTHTFYARATPATGSKFVGWTTSSTDATGADDTNPKTVTITSNEHTTVETKLYAHFAEKKSVNITFVGSANGTYQYAADGGSAVTVSSSGASKNDVESLTLSAPTPNSGYAFAGFYWQSSEGTVTNLSGTSPTVSFSKTEDITVGCSFVSTSLPKFVIKETGVEYYGLKSALAAAASGQTVVPTGNHTVDGSDLMEAENKTYTIPGGVTLLIPYDAAYTVETAVPTAVAPAAASNCKPYRTLTLASGVKLNVMGSISVATKQFATNTSEGQHGVRTYYGFVDMKANSEIILQNGANLYAWGYISGDGSITAKSGSNVYEMFQFTDFRGGKRTTGMAGNSQKVFPFQQYYIQNIETKLTLEYGASEYVSAILYISDTMFPNTCKFIGTSGAMFTMTSGSVSKEYDKSKDRVHYVLDGNASLSPLSLTFKYLVFSYTVSSGDYVLPINNNMTIDVKSGRTFTVTQDMSILPDAEINIESGAKVVVNSGCRLYVYDKDEWAGKGCVFSNADVHRLAFVGRNHSNTYGAPFARTIGGDAHFNINGELEMSGTLYTTSHGADIKSSEGTGKITLKAKAGTDTKTYQDKGNSEMQEIPITAAQLHNGNNSYTKTAGAPANTTVYYKNGHWGWKVTWKDDNNTEIKTEYCYTKPSDSWISSNKPANPTQSCKTFSSWSQTSNDETNQERVYTATYTTNTYAITYAAGTYGSGSLAGGTKTCDVAYTLANNSSAFTRVGYTYDGWSTNADGSTKDYNLGGSYTTNAAQTFYPHWVATTYTLSYNLDGGSVDPSNPTNYNIETATFTLTNPTKTGYTFAGWTGTGLAGATMTVTIAKGSTGNRSYTATWNCAEPTSLSVASNGNKWDFCSGESMTLTVSGSNIAADATYLWKISKDGGSTYTNASGTNNAATYTVASMAAANGGKYTCTVTNGSCSATSAGVDVKVWYLHINNGAAGVWQDIAFINTGTGTGTANVTLESDHAYGFKLWNELGESIGWYGLDSKTISGTESNITLNSSGANVSINSGLGGTYVFTIDYTSATSPKISVTYPTANQPSGRKIYFDKSVIAGWGSNVYYRIGHTTYNSNQTLSLVPGTDQFYEMTTNRFDGFEAWQIANNVSWSGDGNSIYLVNPDGTTYDITKATNFQKYVVGPTGVTIVPTTENNTESGCTYWNISTSDGMLTHTATIIEPTNGTIHIAYTDVSGTAQDKTTTTAGLAHRTILTITATPNSGYRLASLTVNGSAFSNEGTHVLAANATIAATFESSESGFYVDIVDVDNSARKLKLNVSGWPASGWPYYVNGTAYIRDVDRLADRTMWIPYTGKPGEEFPIMVRQLTVDGALISNHTYEIPKEVMSNSTLSAAESNPLYVKGTTMTVSLNMTASNIYVAPDAKLHVVSGKTLTVDTIFLRTTPTSAAELILDGELNAEAQVVYTRIISSKSAYFQFGLPLDCDVKLEDIRLSNGTDPKYYTGSGWVLRAYDEESRANNGLGDNWVSLGKTDKIKGGIGYEMYSGMNYYREFYFPVDVKDLSSDLAVTYTEGPNVADNGWNMLVSPMTSTYIKEPMPEDLVISWMEADGFSAQEVPSSIPPAKVFAYQAAAAGTISFDMSSNAPVRNYMAAAAEQTRIQWMHLDIKDANGVGDQTSIYSHPTRYEASYQPGIDVAKQSLTASRAIIYSSHAYGEMAFAGVADELLEQGVALTVYSPKAQELTISMRENEWLNRMAYVWLIDQATGAQIDLLESDYSFNAEAGTTAGRFILMGAFFAPQITTDNGTVQSDDEDIKAKKFIYKDKMYIQINGVIYDATGKLVK